MKKAQFWYADFLVAVMILMIIGVLFVYSIKDLTSRNEILKDLILEASDISSVLMSEGYLVIGDPYETYNWDVLEGTVGFMTNNKFDIEKFDMFNLLGSEKQRYMLGTFNNVWIYMADSSGDVKFYIPNDGYASINDIDSNNLVHIKRFVFYDNTPDNDETKGEIYILGVVVFK